MSNEQETHADDKSPVVRCFIVHYYADEQGDMSECGRGFFSDVSFEHGTSDVSKVTCKQCLKMLSIDGA